MMCLCKPPAIKVAVILFFALTSTRLLVGLPRYDFLSQSGPEDQYMLDEGLVRYVALQYLCCIGPGLQAEGAIPQEVCVAERRRVRHGDPSRVGQFIARAMVGATRTESWELEGSVMKLAQRASGLIMYISMDRPDLQFSSKTARSCVPKRGRRVHGGRRQRLGQRSRDTPINNGGAGEAGKPPH